MRHRKLLSGSEWPSGGRRHRVLPFPGFLQATCHVCSADVRQISALDQFGVIERPHIEDALNHSECSYQFASNKSAAPWLDCPMCVLGAPNALNPPTKTEFTLVSIAQSL